MSIPRSRYNYQRRRGARLGAPLFIRVEDIRGLTSNHVAVITSKGFRFLASLAYVVNNYRRRH